jgi:hypothetical protein
MLAFEKKNLKIFGKFSTFVKINNIISVEATNVLWGIYIYLVVPRLPPFGKFDYVGKKVAPKCCPICLKKSHKESNIHSDSLPPCTQGKKILLLLSYFLA